MNARLKELLRLVIEAELLSSRLDSEGDDIEEMVGCGSIGAMGYALPLGMDPNAVNVGVADMRTTKKKKRSKKGKKKIREQRDPSPFSNSYVLTSFIPVPDEVFDRLAESEVNVSDLQVIGDGLYGEAYRDGETVVKVTTDVLEAKASNSLLGKSPKHVVHVRDVFGLRRATKTVFFIVEEFLDPITGEEARAFSKATGPYGMRVGPILIPYANGDWSAFKDRALEAARRCAKYDVFGNEDVKQLQNAYQKSVTEALDVLQKQFQMDQIIKELHDLGIRHTDYKCENLRKRGDDFVVIDLSEATSSGVEPDVIVMENGQSDELGIAH